MKIDELKTLKEDINKYSLVSYELWPVVGSDLPTVLRKINETIDKIIEYIIEKEEKSGD